MPDIPDYTDIDPWLIDEEMDQQYNKELYGDNAHHLEGDWIDGEWIPQPNTDGIHDLSHEHGFVTTIKNEPPMAPEEQREAYIEWWRARQQKLKVLDLRAAEKLAHQQEL